MQRSFLYRLYLTQAQQFLFEETLEICRRLYNNALAQRIDAFVFENKTLSCQEQQYQLPALKRIAPALKAIYSQVAQDALKRLDRAYQNFFRRIKEGMLKNHCLARAISDCGWGQFFAVLKHQAAMAAKQVIEINPHRTSQNCPGCGRYVPKALHVRVHSCPYCGLQICRDKNAAENIKKKGRDTAFREPTAVAVG